MASQLMIGLVVTQSDLMFLKFIDDSFDGLL